MYFFVSIYSYFGSLHENVGINLFLTYFSYTNLISASRPALIVGLLNNIYLILHIIFRHSIFPIRISCCITN